MDGLRMDSVHNQPWNLSQHVNHTLREEFPGKIMIAEICPETPDAIHGAGFDSIWCVRMCATPCFCGACARTGAPHYTTAVAPHSSEGTESDCWLSSRALLFNVLPTVRRFPFLVSRYEKTRYETKTQRWTRSHGCKGGFTTPKHIHGG